jgi:hypothetical protein
MSILDSDALWLPNGEDYGGVTDRHLVVSRGDVATCLNIIEDVLLKPIQLSEEIGSHQELNVEQVLKYHLGRKKLLHKVKRFPYVMYLARSARADYPTWEQGHYEPAVGHYVKYKKEFQSASAYATVIRSRADWESGSWEQFVPEAMASLSIPLSRRLCRASKLFYYEGLPKIRSALRRPGRIGRLIRFYKRTFITSAPKRER